MPTVPGGFPDLETFSFAIEGTLDLVVPLVKAATRLKFRQIVEYSADSKFNQVLRAAASLGTVVELEIRGADSLGQWKISREFKRFSTLEVLTLGEYCSMRDAPSFTILRRLPLQTLHFEAQTSVSEAHLLRLISGSDKIPTLRSIRLDNISAAYRRVDVRSRAKEYLRAWLMHGYTLPKWTETFSRAGCEDLFAAAATEGIKLVGIAVTAIRSENKILNRKKRVKQRIEALKAAEEKKKKEKSFAPTARAGGSCGEAQDGTEDVGVA